MLFKDAQLDGIRSGAITRSFRFWKQARVRKGGVYRIRPDLAIRVTDVSVCTKRPSAADAVRAGFGDVEALEKALGRARGQALYLVKFERCDVPEDNRIKLAHSALSDESAKGLRKRLADMDRRRAAGPWTGAILELIERFPERRAADLAALMGWPTADFKQHVRRLKALGLTLSLEVGYRLSPLGSNFRRTAKERQKDAV
jgi:hypothetical protein